MEHYQRRLQNQPRNLSQPQRQGVWVPKQQRVERLKNVRNSNFRLSYDENQVRELLTSNHQSPEDVSRKWEAVPPNKAELKAAKARI